MSYRNDQESFWATGGGEDHAGGEFRTGAQVDRQYLRLFGIRQSEQLPILIDRRDGVVREVGCGRGDQLQILHEAGFRDLGGIEINPVAVRDANEGRPWLKIVCGSAYDLPYDDDSVDVAYTCGVLIHQPPEDVHEVAREIMRVVKPEGRICGVEYWSETFEARTPERTWSGPYDKCYQVGDWHLAASQMYPMAGVVVHQFALEENHAG